MPVGGPEGVELLLHGGRHRRYRMQEPNQAWTPAEQRILWRGRRQSHNNGPKRIPRLDHGTEGGEQMDQCGIAVTSGELGQPIPECVDVAALWVGGIRR